MENNWYVIAGAPSSGKTTIINLLKDKGFNVMHEMARVYIDYNISNGKKIEEIRENNESFQEEILKLKIEAEKNLSKKVVTFFDSAIPDSDAHYTLGGVRKSDLLSSSMIGLQYKKVFLLDILDFQKDYARTETREEQVELHRLLEESYRKIDVDIVKVSVMPPSERLKFILDNL